MATKMILWLIWILLRIGRSVEAENQNKIEISEGTTRVN